MGVKTDKLKSSASWCVNHVQYLLIVVCVAMTVAETLIFPPVGAATTLFVCVHVLSLVLMPWRPRVCCNIVLLTFVACCFIPDDGGPSLLWGTWLALGYVGMRITSWWGVLYPLAVSTVRMWRFNADGVPLNEYVMLIFVMFFAFFIGKSLAWKEFVDQARRNELKYEKLSQHIEYLRREHMLAGRIHDSIAGNLTYMAIVLDGFMLDAENPSDKHEMRKLRTLVVETLHEVRDVVDMMHGSDRQGSKQDEHAYLAELRGISEQGDAFLRELGFHGQTKIEIDNLNNLDGNYVREILSLVHELYTNIAVHGSPEGTYYIAVGVHDDNWVHVDSVNDVSLRSLFPDKPLSKKGLALHRRWIESVGGFARTSSEGDTWHFHACFPAAMAGDVLKFAGGQQ